MSMVMTDDQNYKDIANAIRSQNETDETYTPSQMGLAIQNLNAIGSVKYNVSQSLTDDEKQQARTNIDAINTTYVDSTILAARSSVSLVTLLASGWAETHGGYTQSVTVDGIVADITQQLINVNPYNDKDQIIAICNANIICVSQDTNTLTFSAGVIPEIDVQFIIEWKSINYII